MISNQYARFEEHDVRYPHRFNRDQTIDSICPFCYVTIASAKTEAALRPLEMTHKCEPALLRYYEEQRLAACNLSDRNDEYRTQQPRRYQKHQVAEIHAAEKLARL